MSFIDVKSLCHKFAVKDKDGNRIGENMAVRDLDLQIEKGQIIAVLGRNGSGKSTFARHLNGLLQPDSGTIVVAGESPADSAHLLSIRRKVGMVFQNPDNQIVGSTLAEDVGFGLENIGTDSDDIWMKIDEALGFAGLAAYEHRSTSHLSGGQKQRLAVASVMAMEPECIVCDEVTSMLDPQGAQTVMELLQRLNREKGVTVIMVTHRISEAMAADMVYIMNAGTVAMSGAPEKVLCNVKNLVSYGLEVPLSMKVKAGIPVDICFRDKYSAMADKHTCEAVVDDPDKLHVTAAGEKDVCVETGGTRATVIDLDTVSYTYKGGTDVTCAVNDVSVNIRSGEIVAVIGKTGSGKSTLLQLASRLLVPDSGVVKLFGENIGSIKNFKPYRKRVGYVFQFPESQLFESTVLRDVMYGPLNFGMSKSEAENHARDALRLVGVSDRYLEYSPFELSGGLKKRVAFAGILAYEPDILILDEPACGLDGESRERLFDIVRKLNREFGKTILFVSHDMEDVYEMTERVVLMDEGRVAYDGGTKEFFDDEKLLGQYGILRPEGAMSDCGECIC